MTHYPSIGDAVGAPAAWDVRVFTDCTERDSVEHRMSIPQGGYKGSGQFPVVDQGGGLVAGYTDDDQCVHLKDLPIILFGDHTRIFKYIDFPFATGGDGTQLFKAKHGLIDPKFLYFALLALNIPSRGYSRHFKYLKEMRIAFPSDPGEQERIAGVLSHLKGLIDTNARMTAKLKELKAATMAKLFREGLRGEPLKATEIGEIPESWAVRPLGDLLLSAQYGLSVRGAREGRCPILRMNCQQDGEVVFDDLQYVNLGDHVLDKFRLTAGDILFNRTNSHDLVGRTAIYRGRPMATFASYLIRLRVDGKVMLPDFLNCYLNLAHVQDSLKWLASRGVSQSNISASKLKGFMVPVPEETGEQEEIIKKVAVLSGACSFAARKGQGYRALFSSLLAMLMTGRLRVSRVPGAPNGGVTVRAGC